MAPLARHGTRFAQSRPSFRPISSQPGDSHQDQQSGVRLWDVWTEPCDPSAVEWKQVDDAPVDRVAK